MGPDAPFVPLQCAVPDCRARDRAPFGKGSFSKWTCLDAYDCGCTLCTAHVHPRCPVCGRPTGYPARQGA